MSEKSKPYNPPSQKAIVANIPQIPEVTPEEISDFNQRSRDRWVAEKAKTLISGTKILDIGAGTCPYKELFSHCEYKSHDFKRYEGTKLGGTTEYGAIDYVSDILDIPVADGSFDAILCTEVFEHIPEPIKALYEISRILRPGGTLFITAPLGSGLHQEPFHFYGGFTPHFYKHFGDLSGLEVIETIPNGGFFKHLSQECSRVAWIWDKHKHLHGEQPDEVLKLFRDALAPMLFALDERCPYTDFTVGYFVEMRKASRYP